MLYLSFFFFLTLISWEGLSNLDRRRALKQHCSGSGMTCSITSVIWSSPLVRSAPSRTLQRANELGTLVFSRFSIFAKKKSLSLPVRRNGHGDAVAQIPQATGMLSELRGKDSAQGKLFFEKCQFRINTCVRPRKCRYHLGEKNVGIIGALVVNRTGFVSAMPIAIQFYKPILWKCERSSVCVSRSPFAVVPLLFFRL